MFLLDTNTVIYFFKGLGNVTARLLEVRPADVAISSITLFELHVGIQKSGSPSARLEQLSHFASFTRVIDFSPREAAAAAELRATLERLGRPIGPLDNLLAGTALAHQATFVTRNLKEFSRVRGLEVVSWY
jgi:tRNA(fMet)-specific endonuclease VapC